MTRQKLFTELESILEEAKTAVLASRDDKGYPHMRWMTPAILRGRQDALYALTSSAFAKVTQVSENPEVEWMFQNLSLTRVINLRGKVNVIDNPSIRSLVLENVLPRLRAFWKAQPDERDLIVLETVLEEAIYYLPMDGTKETIRL
jgi:pyridoxamine 5'-phosphate oxidase